MTAAQHSELGNFLRARRARVSPADVGLPSGIGVRRTPGLRREELATLAGVSVDYYTRLERGRENNPSSAVVESLANALRLDDEERAFLRGLAAIASRAGVAPSPPAPVGKPVRASVKLLLESLRPSPAYLLSRTNDVLACNPGGLGLLAGMADYPARQRNTIRYTFLHPAARDLWPDWHQKATNCIAHLRAVMGHETDAPDVAALVDELSVKSPEFGELWARYDVRRSSNGSKRFLHPVVGGMTLSFEAMEMPNSNARLVVYLAEPGTPDHDAMVLLDMATVDAQRETPAAADRRPVTDREETR
jgi:transcriptional regulator with XRE-family HTH domain